MIDSSTGEGLSIDRASHPGLFPFLHGRRVINRSRFDENGPVQLVGVEARAVGNSPLSHGPSPSESKSELSVTRRLLTDLPRRSRSASCRQLAAFSRASPVGVEERAVGNSPLSHGPPLLGRSRFSLSLGFSEKYAFSPDTLKIQQNIHSFKPDFGLFCKKRQS